MSVNINRALKFAAFSMGCFLSLSVILFFTAFPSHAAGSEWIDNFENDSSVMTNDWTNRASCTRNVALSSDESISGDWSLTFDRTGASPACTDQENLALSDIDGDIITGDYWIRATETNVTNIAINFYDGIDLVAGQKISTGNFYLSGGTTVMTGLDDDTWYHIGWYFDKASACTSAKVINGTNEYATAECGSTGTVIDNLNVRAGGTVSTIVYIDNMSVSAASESFELPNSFSDIFGDESNVGTILADYPSHDDVYGACSIWGGIFSGSTDDGAACIWTWIQYALVPEDFSVAGLLASPVRMLESRWPFTYITVPLNAIGTGLDNGDCPFTEQLFTDDLEFNGSTVTIPDFDVCDIFETPDLAAGFAAHTTAQSAVVAFIYVSLGVLIWKKSDDFMRG